MIGSLISRHYRYSLFAITISTASIHRTLILFVRACSGATLRTWTIFPISSGAAFSSRRIVIVIPPLTFLISLFLPILSISLSLTCFFSDSDLKGRGELTFRH